MEIHIYVQHTNIVVFYKVIQRRLKTYGVGYIVLIFQPKANTLNFRPITQSESNSLSTFLSINATQHNKQQS